MTEPQTEPQTEPGKEIAKVKVALNRPIDDLDAAWRLATALAFSNLLPDAFRNKPSNALVLMMYGRDLAMTPMQSFQAIYVVNGKPQLAADAWMALAKRSGYEFNWLQRSRERAVLQIIDKDRPDKPHVEEFTVEDAVAAHLLTRDKDGNLIARDSHDKPKPWELYTRRMLQNRCLSFGAKAFCPEVALGFGIEGDYDYIDTEAVETTTTVEAHRPEMHGQEQTRSQAELQADVLAAEARFRSQTIPDPAAPTDTADAPSPSPNEPVDAEVVEDQADETPTHTEPADPEADLFARADEQAAREMGPDDANDP
jgi:hypothetical protein